MFISGGEKVYSAEVEGQLAEPVIITLKEY